MSDAPIVIVQFTEDGDMTYHVAGEARLLIVDERVPNDRVYEWLSRRPRQEVEAIIGDSEIGSSRDGRHEAISARIAAHLDGKRNHLRVVDTEEPAT